MTRPSVVPSLFSACVVEPVWMPLARLHRPNGRTHTRYTVTRQHVTYYETTVLVMFPDTVVSGGTAISPGLPGSTADGGLGRPPEVRAGSPPAHLLGELVMRLCDRGTRRSIVGCRDTARHGHQL